MESVKIQKDRASTKKVQLLTTEDFCSSIEKLNNDCLISIFHLLPVADRIRAERVCRRWQEVAKDSWSTFKVLNLDPRCLGLRLRGKRRLQYSLINQHLIEKILRRCGRYLESFVADFFIRKKFVHLIAEYCQNIKSLTWKEATVKDLKELFKCNNIVKLDTVFSTALVEKEEKVLAELFFKNRKLRIVNIVGLLGTGECLLKLPLEEIEGIKLRFAHLCHKNIANAIHQTKKLKSFENDYTNEEVIKALALNCSNLSELNLSCHPSHKKKVENIDSLLSEVFRNNKKLKSLILKKFENLTGRCLLDLDQNTVEKIILEDAKLLNSDYLIQSLPNFVKMHSLELYSLFCSDKRDRCNKWLECINRCQSLRKLIVFNMLLSEEVLINAVFDLKNLEMLKAWSNSSDGLVTKELLNHISCNLKELKYLHLYYCENVCDEDFKSLSNLKKLESLYLIEVNRINGSGLGGFPNLKELICPGCEKLEDDFLIRMLKCASQLAYLDIRECDQVTSAVIKVAIEETKMRTNNTVLTIHTTLSCKEWNEKYDMPSLLKLIKD